MCLHVRDYDPFARSGIGWDGERWFRMNVKLDIYTYLGIFITIGWIQIGCFHPFHRNAADARLIGELSLFGRNYLQLIFSSDQPWR